jgi:hypothetical protein
MSQGQSLGPVVQGHLDEVVRGTAWRLGAKKDRSGDCPWDLSPSWLTPG